ncbi:hypothetical protein [Sphingobium subterraneum]|uniref:ABC-type Fe3+-siderophore transport system permease subunit n=1 Tax=Sphingobium subterraneum TaxID=627688 RepID=A0A841J947_9SPHN|nr:hypothetical protein [Sphingobium subterraneum]MBB6125035.1 ABC-type Fe3+-siderophore transport system permease subunit [Sphingobium subterraneum]
MKKVEEMIGAWVDNNLDEAEAARMAALAAEVPSVAAKADRLRHIGELVRAAVPEEPVSDELLERMGLKEAPESNVVDFVSASSGRTGRVTNPAEPKKRTSWSWDMRRAAAVLVLAGTGLSVFGLASLSVTKPEEAQYHVLGDKPVAGSAADILVLFDAGTGTVQAKTAAAAVGAKIVGPATSAGAWKLAAGEGGRDAALKALRARPDVVLAEPLGGEP